MPPGSVDDPVDSLAADVFGALIETARDLLEGTAAFVSLVGDRRQFFKARMGLEESWVGAHRTPLLQSFCQQVVTTNAPLLVSDSRLDARGHLDGAREQLNLIAYAGVPLVDKGNHALGALCVVDHQPRQWTQREVRTLTTLAKAVMAEAALRQTLERTWQVAESAGAGIWNLDVVTGTAKTDARTTEWMGLPRGPLDITRRKTAEVEREEFARQLAEKEALLRMVMESAGMSAWSMDCRTRLITADERFLQLYGLSSSSPVPLSAVLAQMHPEDRPATEHAIEAALSGQNEGRYLAERRIRGPSGAYHWGETRAQVTFAPDGTPRTMQGVSFDISVRKEAEALREVALQHTRAESERQQLIFEQAPASIALLEGPEHRFRVANASYVQLVGGRKVLGRSVAEALPEVVEQGFIALLDTVRRTGNPHVGQETWLHVQRHPGGPPEEVCLNFVYQPIRNASGQVDSIFVHAVEVTDLVRSRETARQAVRELERLTETLRVNEERLDLAMNVVGAGIWELDMSTQEVLADRRFRELFGLALDEPFALDKGLAIVHPEDRPRVTMAIADAIAGKHGGAYEADYRTVPRADGSSRWVAARGQVFLTPEGKARRFIGTGVDISERKNAELAQAQLLRSIANQDVFGVAVLEGDALRFTLANEGYRRICGGRDVLGKPMLEALPELVGQGTDALLHEVLRTGRPVMSSEARFLVDMHGTGVLEARFFTFTWQAIPSQEGGFSSVLVLSHDITEGVRARTALEATAERLHHSETRLALALEVSGTGMWEMDLTTHALTADPRFREMFGLTPEEPFNLAKGLAIIHAEDRERVAALVEGALAGRDHGRYEADYRTVPRPDGGVRWVAARGQTTFDDSGRAIRFLGTGTDITALKQAEWARASFLRSLTAQSIFGIAVLRGEELRFEASNSVYRKMVGDRDLVGRPFLEALPEFAHQGVDAGMREVLRTGTPFAGRELGYQMLRHGGGATPEERSFTFVWQPILESSGVVESLLIITHDVTDQVRARRRIEGLLAQLAASEERQKRMVAASGAGLWEISGATGRMTADARMVELMGLPSGTVFNLELGLDEVNPEDRESVARAMAAALAGENAGSYLMQFRTGGRHGAPERWVESRAQRVVDPQGGVVLAGAMLDITGRKQAEAERERLLGEVESSRVRLANLIENAPAFVATLREPEHVFELVNPLYQRLVGVGRELLGQPVRYALPEVVEQGFLGLLDGVYRTGEPFVGREIPVQLDRAGDGRLETAFVNFVYQPRRGAQGQMEGIDVFGFEVTDQVLARRQAESLSQRLRESEDRLRRVVEASGAGFWELDTTTGRITADARVMTLLGLTPGAPLNLELALACVYAEDRESLAQALPTALAGAQGEQFLMAFRVVGLEDVPQRWVEIRGQRRLDTHGQAVALAGALLDITERKTAEEASKSLLRALGDSEERYRLATRATKDAIWDWNVVTGGMTWNEVLREQFGFLARQVRPDADWWLEHIHPEDRERVSRSLHAVIDTPGSSDWSETYRFQRQDGSWAHVEDRGWVTRGAAGQAVRMVGAMQDVTERKAAEDILARQSRHHALSAQVGLALTHNNSLREMLQECVESLVNHLGAAFARVWLLEPKHHVLELRASAGLYTHLDGPHGRVPVGRYKIGLIAQERQPHLTNDVQGDARVGDQEWARREGMKAFAGYPLLVGDKLVGVVALFSREALASDTLDTLRLVADSIALGIERLRAEDELKARADFEQKLIGIVSHDLRNPLNAILLGATVLFQREVLDARGTKSLLRIQSAADRAARMVKDLLDFTQARLGGGLKIEPKPMDLHEVTRGVVEEVEAAWPGRELEVEHEGAAQMDGDADRLGQVVQNLVTNALKYSPEDSPVRVVTRGAGERLSLSVFNRGVPIPADKLESIFEPMQRATAEVDKAGRSVGLGLYIVKSIVAAHGGHISVTSSAADGTVFTVSLPR